MEEGHVLAHPIVPRTVRPNVDQGDCLALLLIHNYLAVAWGAVRFAIGKLTSIFRQ